MEIYVVEFFVKDDKGFIRKPLAYFEKNEAIKVAREFASKRAIGRRGGTLDVLINHSIGYEMSFVISYKTWYNDKPIIDNRREVCRVVAADFVD